MAVRPRLRSGRPHLRHRGPGGPASERDPRLRSRWPTPANWVRGAARRADERVRWRRTVHGPPPPVVGEDGTTFLVTEDSGTTVYGLDATGRVIAGWPYRDTAGLQWDYPLLGDVGGSSRRSAPAVGPGDVLYLLHPPRAATLGGTIVAVGPDGRVGTGWPVELRQPGSEFWSIVVGLDGTIYALAIEPESGDTSSASILAIAPDSTVLWTTTIIDP